MERFTKRDADGGIVPTKPMRTCKMIYKLAEYEDEAEQREKGCEYCPSFTNREMGLGVNPQWVQVKFCPICGKRLEVKE